jgi:hypothetical protein
VSGIFLDHLQKHGAKTRLEKAVVAQARREVLKHYKPGDTVEVSGNVGVVQTDGSLTPLWKRVRNGYSRGSFTLNDDTPVTTPTKKSRTVEGSRILAYGTREEKEAYLAKVRQRSPKPERGL